MSERFERIKELIADSSKEIKILPVSEEVRSAVEETYKINPESTMGALVYNSGGLIIDNWLRVYGSGELNLVERSKLCEFDCVAVGEDICGGLFLMFSGDSMGYFAPDTLEVEDMEMTYSEFLRWSIAGDTDLFYETFRWSSWCEDVKDIALDSGVAFYPFLWADAESIDTRSRKIIPMSEIIGIQFEYMRQLG